MIRYKNILQRLKEAGYNTGRIRQEKLLAESVLANLRANKPISMNSLNEICRLCQCRVEELIEYVPDDGSCPDVPESAGVIIPSVESKGQVCSSAAFQLPVPGADDLKVTVMLTLEQK